MSRIMFAVLKGTTAGRRQVTLKCIVLIVSSALDVLTLMPLEAEPLEKGF
jgi:hypothetical protein